VRQDARHPGFGEGEELSIGHLARRHGEFAMTGAGDFPAFLHYKLVGQDETRGRVALHQSPGCFGVASCPVALLLIWGADFGCCQAL
jgi:hypothetical protein